ncbi:hypothetical protein [Mycobacterium sp. 94-17]|uniref:hypothetical protein n=1 Tax=Mycobacterium sp. 94-17 TaxID=2986147 RepID=UPI002D1EAC3C|nr:hypothetical protein [Mycobacterium sp. 94-17]MEB4209560.1 hypothetical protein [Mycobacterium sp. 94-17]
MKVCTDEFARLSRYIPVNCDGNPVVTITNPLHLSNWTLPVVEWFWIISAAVCLAHAIRWYRRRRDASNVVVWCTGITALLLIEPTSYFPQWFGLEQKLGLTFVHNQFTINFLYNRIPLYIIACYPLFLYISYVLVQRTGIFQRYTPFVGALSVAMVYHFLWEIVDPLGAQWLWWVWNTKLSTSQPALGVVPLLNIQVFTITMPFGVTLAALLLCRVPHRGGWYIVRDVAVNSVAVWPIIFISAVPSTVADLMGAPLGVARAVQCWGWVALAVVVGAWAYVGALRARRSDASLVPDDVRSDRLALRWVVVYFAITLAFWMAAMPGYFSATNGVAANGGQLGSLPYAIFAYLGSIILVWASYAATIKRPEPTQNPVLAPA